ncbi:hypothetical protein EXN66_Car014441 [Channa argus]|uniref:Uncharacterized protein n=1 Tax=Channa argus TaxID=215402 RepID=A0A6G1Q8L3_CHAAH|nr:hypothetical protein EXN66_Car014441 [Channa argus]
MGLGDKDKEQRQTNPHQSGHSEVESSKLEIEGCETSLDRKNLLQHHSEQRKTPLHRGSHMIRHGVGTVDDRRHGPQKCV